MPHTRTTRQAILAEAAQLFYTRGIQATGLEEIAQKVGVTKASLYYHFKNRDELLEEALKQHSAQCRADYLMAWEKFPHGSTQKFLVLFTEAEQAAGSPAFFGCPFLNAAAEVTNPVSPVRQIAHNHYQFVQNSFTQFARDAQLREPEALAQALTSLVVGSYANWLATGSAQAIRVAKQLAEQTLIANESKN
jgi:AcrR family transcriptional regulator